MLARSPSVPLVSRSFDVAMANAIINDPSVFPLVAMGTTEPLDLAPLIADHRNVLLEAEGGFVLFCHDEPGIYQVHTAFLQNHRGKHAIVASLEAYRWMFTHTECMILLTMIPVFNRAAALSARIVGFAPDFERAAFWPKDGELGPTKFYSLHYRDWLKRDSEYLTAAGRQFHAELDAEYERLGRAPHAHPDEACHDLAAGACAETIYGGQPEKAALLYNRWARFAGYGQISVLSRSPLVIDIGEAVLMIGERGFRVVKCR